ncbi:putative membrane protein [Monoraphidium neglectum]|uniref:Putative membrane protein n=1 Tax=Monoraphidium neglectum TaxID=145388 RepID=A0A0D2M482_9CHLO|nr:putative membrane protein [Monoraphidium neglectum]KIY98379.1 putative membrane protein [Monoraphidium neglectum]|eukprot:XP_013897399.1 putative membrane protein [Monoraphidium neglectum]
MGARLMFHCLLELDRLAAEGAPTRGLVENVVLLGAPVSCRPERWAAARSVVAGRLVNAYSVNDWSLQILFRAHSASSLYTAAAGCWRVGCPGVEDVNVSRVIRSSDDYVTRIEDVLDAINLTGA